MIIFRMQVLRLYCFGLCFAHLVCPEVNDKINDKIYESFQIEDIWNHIRGSPQQISLSVLLSDPSNFATEDSRSLEQPFNWYPWASFSIIQFNQSWELPNGLKIQLDGRGLIKIDKGVCLPLRLYNPCTDNFILCVTRIQCEMHGINPKTKVISRPKNPTVICIISDFCVVFSNESICSICNYTDIISKPEDSICAV